MLSTTSCSIIAIHNLFKTFQLKSKSICAVCDVTLDVIRGETLGIVGESGSGKSTLARIMVGLLKPDSGLVEFEGIDVHNPSKSERMYLTQNIQMVFQNPYASLNPRMSIMDVLAEPFVIHKKFNSKQALKSRVYELLEEVGLNPQWANRYPHEFSGGQRQRIAIARALALKPKFLVCDEAVSALDVSVQAQIILLLKRIQKEYGLTMVFISHDLSVVRLISDRVGVLYKGELLELNRSSDMYCNPQNHYTKTLLNAVLPADVSIAKSKLEASA
ncbi:ATP-binding cassette domain-containing protein [Taylorella equigenitalis]|uniref:Oligopeptide transport ATP-binding protein OppF n=3 Tax=Taylorella equigenitalis TaxID=29575 RepID=A0A654KGQ7_TAYEM|nr:dipeptide/oligopeptide/nickel ABC transporter ATP-binding protein [Taylorella equigenitalis]ADU91570.1 Oligopeptide transport ATP-binding protein OppF [Taylorella equigenitalis MCE9]AFN35111.1 ABC transporter ATP-binding protein [Taylorella equigenitalis ATCC 35865]ASY37112.1 ABC transporter ATP-binding protein [Taylorella equigenitalis]ASY38558.1 ABC transporter ATP-binding protein [Taylorella equigenitalis]ASY40104.1 ABC transporter ATP-binding protein [Taylorella equigenitalis]